MTGVTKRGLWGFAVLVILVILAGAAFSKRLTAQETRKSFKVGLAVLRDNPDYNTAEQSFVDVLEKQNDMTVEFKSLNAHGDLEAYEKGLEKMVYEDKVDLIFITGTRSTVPAVEIVKEIPVVFTAVADPEGAGIVKSLEQPGGNFTGTHCDVPVVAQIRTILKVFPEVKRIGIVYTEGERNAEIQTRDFKDIGESLGLQILTSMVSKDCKTEEEVAAAAKKLIGKVDILVGHQDTSISRYGKGMLDVAEANNIPTYVTLGQLLNAGAVFSLGIDFGALGAISGGQAVRILKEKARPADIPVSTSRNYSLIINLTAAKKIGLNIPVEVLRAASRIIK